MPDENSSNWNFHKAQTFFYERMKTRIPSKSIDAGYNHSNRDENVITPSFNSIKSRNNLDKLDFKSGTNFLSVLVQKASINANMDFLDSIAYGSTKTGTDSSNSPARKQLRPQVLPMFKLSSLFQYNQLTNHRAKPLESKKKKFNILDGFKIPKKSIFKTNKSHLHKGKIMLNILQMWEMHSKDNDRKQDTTSMYIEIATSEKMDLERATSLHLLGRMILFELSLL